MRTIEVSFIIFHFILYTLIYDLPTVFWCRGLVASLTLGASFSLGVRRDGCSYVQSELLLWMLQVPATRNQDNPFD